jgi:predicted nucleic acid-binding protein
MKPFFADTFYFLALVNSSDPAHGRTVAFTSGNVVRLVTTDWVLTELADGLARSRRGRSEFLSTLADLQADGDATIVRCDAKLMDEGVQLYAQRADKEWSLTDCISFVVMQQEGIIAALTGDKHFEQAGFIALLK